MNIQSLLGQFGSMMNMMKSNGNPMETLGSMMGGNQNPALSRALKEAQRLQGEKGISGFEQFVRAEFQKSGLDIQEVRKTLGI